MNGTNKTTFTIFGGTGDLSYRKLLPALFNLYLRSKLGQNDRILVIGRRDYTTNDYIEIIKDWIIKFARFEKNEASLQQFFKHIQYLKMDFTNIQAYENLSSVLNEGSFDKNIFYLAVAPKFFEQISCGLASICQEKNVSIVLEKPFGETLARAEELSSSLENNFGAENIYRIDHYLGKEMVRSILNIRSTNPIFIKSWNNDCIQEVHISALEEEGVGTRGGYYDEAGAMKDMLQNHLMQILTIVAMELPNSIMDITSIQANQEKLLSCLRPLNKVDIKKDVTIAQYEGYLDELQISPNSTTETYAKCQIFVDNERWKNVPFILTTGKKLNTRLMEVVIWFKPIGDAPANSLVFDVQPREGVKLRFNIKEPGESENIIPVEMDFCQSCNMNFNHNTPEAYERLIDAVFQGDRIWFSTWKQIAASWSYIEGLKKQYHKLNLPMRSYKAGSNGPDES